MILDRPKMGPGLGKPGFPMGWFPTWLPCGSEGRFPLDLMRTALVFRAQGRSRAVRADKGSFSSCLI